MDQTARKQLPQNLPPVLVVGLGPLARAGAD
jgi:hypothetical protein